MGALKEMYMNDEYDKIDERESEREEREPCERI